MIAPVADGAAWRVLAGDAARSLHSFSAGWARAMLADPPGQLGMGGEDWDAPFAEWVDIHASVFGAALYACHPGAPGLVWAAPRTSYFTESALRKAGWLVDGKVYVINSSRRAPSSRHLAESVDEWIKVRAPGASIGPQFDRPWPRNVALLHDPMCAEACATACAVEHLVRHAGVRKSGSRRAGVRKGIGYMGGAKGDGGPALAAAAGTADRFFPTFRYQAPARGKIRDAFLPPGVENECPAAKPPELGAWLVSLISRPGDTVLDLYAGWGGLALGAMLSGRRVVAAELDRGSAAMVETRLRIAAERLGEVVQ